MTKLIALEIYPEAVSLLATGLLRVSSRVRTVSGSLCRILQSYWSCRCCSLDKGIICEALVD